jgi:hypothetical protein
MSEQVDVTDVPEDFPREVFGAVSGFAPKLLLVKTEDGRFKAPTLSSEELSYRFQKCHKLVGKVARASVRSKAGSCANLAEDLILARYLIPLQRDFFATEAEAAWIVRKAAESLNWPLPESLVPKDDGAA